MKFKTINILLIVMLGVILMACSISRKPILSTPVSTIAPQPSPTSLEAKAPTQVVHTQTQPAATNPSVPTATAIPPAKPRAVFIDPNGVLWAWDAGNGQVTQLDGAGSVQDLVISPNGSKVAYTRSDDYLNFTLNVVNTDGSDKKVLMDTAQTKALLSEPGHEILAGQGLTGVLGNNPRGLTWLTDNRSLLLTSSPTFEGPGLSIVNDLYKVDTVSGAHSLLLKDSEGGLPFLSPNGQMIAIARPDQLNLVNVDGSALKKDLLTFQPVLTYSEYAFYPDIVWLPDNSAFRVALPPADPLDPSPGPATIWQVNATGEPGSQIGSLANLSPLYWPLISPNGQRLAYTRPHGALEDNLYALHTSAIDGSDEKVFFQGKGQIIRFHPDSMRLMIWKDNFGSEHLAAPDGSVTPLTDIDQSMGLQWLSENEYLYFGFTGSQWDLRKQTLGQPSQVITKLEGDDAMARLLLDVSGGLK